MDDMSHFPEIRLPSWATSPQLAIEYLIQQLIDRKELRADDAALVSSQIVHRESLGSTAIGGAIAIPHCQSLAVDGIVSLAGRSSAGIAWRGAKDQALVRLVCLFITPASRPEKHLSALKALAAFLGRLPEGPDS